MPFCGPWERPFVVGRMAQSPKFSRFCTRSLLTPACGDAQLPKSKQTDILTCVGVLQANGAFPPPRTCPELPCFATQPDGHFYAQTPLWSAHLACTSHEQPRARTQQFRSTVQPYTIVGRPYVRLSLRKICLNLAVYSSVLKSLGWRYSHLLKFFSALP